MPDDLIHYQLRPAHGVDYADNLEPIRDIGLSIPSPVVATQASRVSIQPGARLTSEIRARVIPDTRIIETDDVRIATALHATGLFERIDTPSKTAIGKAEGETKAHVAATEKFHAEIAAGDQPRPDATDPPPIDTTDEVTP